MSQATRLSGVAIAGVVLGLLAAKALFVGIAITFVVWTIAALVLGALAPSGRSALLGGVVFGFPLASVFSVFARTGGDPNAVAAAALAVGVVGAVSCLAISGVGFFGWSRLRRLGRNASSSAR